MTFGHHDKLFILAFDHRASLREQMFGIRDRQPDAGEEARLADAKVLIWEGFLAALAEGVPPTPGVLVDEEMGATVARAASAAGVVLAMPAEKSGRGSFDFAYGEEFETHIEAFRPDFVKALVRWNPDDDPALKRQQGERLRRLGDWLSGHGCRFLLELLVPPSEEQLARVAGESAVFDTRLRPGLMLEAIREIREAGIEPDAWKIEGIDTPGDCELVARLLRRDHRERVGALVLGRGADRRRVEHWVRTAAAVPGYTGFAIGRTIWWDGVQGWRDGTLSRPQAVEAIAAAYRHFVYVYEEAERQRPPAR
jgi:myo-inositol catabolism protein IolC